jgi:hypothetical protein
MQDNTLVARLQSTRFPYTPSIKCNVLLESLSEESQNIPGATLKSRGLWKNSKITVRPFLMILFIHHVGEAKKWEN